MNNQEIIESLLKQIGKYTGKTVKAVGGQLAKSADTARNATVAGIVTPTVAVPTANKINNHVQNKSHKKEKKYSAAEVQAMAAAMHSKNESLSEKLLISSKKMQKLF